MFEFLQQKISLKAMIITGFLAICLFIFSFFSMKGGILFLLLTSLVYLAYKKPWLSFLLILASAPFFPIFKNIAFIPGLTLSKDCLIATLFFFIVLVPFFKSPKTFWQKFSPHPLFWPLIFLFIWLFITLIRADILPLGVLRLREILLYMAFFFITLFLVKREEQKKEIFSTLIFSSIPINILAIFQFFFFPEGLVRRFDPIAQIWINRVSSTLAHPVIFSEYLIFIFILLAAYFIYVKKWRIPILLYSFFIFVLIYFTYARSAWLAMMFLFLLGGIFLFKKIWRRYKIITGGVILLFLFFVSFIFGFTKAGIYAKFFVSPQYLSNLERIVIAVNILSQGNTRTDLLGHGLGDVLEQQERTTGLSLRDLAALDTERVRREKAKTFVDNQHLKTFAEMGIVGLGIYFWLYTVIIIFVYRKFKKEKEVFSKIFSFVLLLFVPLFILQGIFVDIWDVFPTNLIFWLLVGLI